MTPLRAGLAAAAAALIADQGMKTLLLYGFGFAAMGPGEHVEVLPFFDLVMVWNRGISYGLLQPHGISGTWLLTFFSLAATVALGWWLTRTERVFPAIGLGLVIGGALGNVVDRILYGAVADFFHFHAFGRDWYVFNVADAAIVAGVAVLLVDAFARPGPKPEVQE
jgi:signal peptidase II